MTVFYVDPLNGNDSNNGQSFANRKKTLINVGTVNSDDEIRVIKSTPTSLGNGTWTANTGNDTSPANKNINLVNLTKANDSNPVSCSRTAHGLITGDVILRTHATYYGFYAVTKVDDDNFTLDGTESQATHTENQATIYKVSEFCVKLASSPIKNILCSNGLSATNGSSGTGTSKPWTVSSDVTSGQESNLWLTQRNAARWFRVTSSFSTGKVAYCELDSTLDLSGFQQISLRFFIDQISSSQKSTSGIFSLRLCSDTQGDTTVNTIPITPPSGDDTDSAFWWTYDNGANLGSNINSVALYVNVAPLSTCEIILENIIACKAKSAADSLHLGSLISKGTTNSSTYYGIDGIVDDIVILKFNYEDNNDYTISTETTSNVRNDLRHNETTETVTTYKVDPYTPDPTMYDTGEDTYCNLIRQDGANDYSNIVSGGWNTTDMSTQDTNAMSWLSQFGQIYRLIDVSPSTSVSNIGQVGGNNKNHSSEGEASLPTATWSNCHFLYHREFLMSQPVKMQDCKIIGCGLDTSDSIGSNSTLWVDCDFLNTKLGWENNYSEPQYFTGCTFNGTPPGSVYYTFFTRNPSYPEWSSMGRFYNCTFKNTQLFSEFWRGIYSLVNCSFNNVNLFEDTDHDDHIATDRLPRFSFINYDNTANDHRIYYHNGLVVSDSSITQSGSGYSWKYTPLENVSNLGDRLYNPIQFKLAEVAVVANAQVTASVYIRRSATSSGTGTHNECGLALLARPNLHLGITTDLKQKVLASGGTNDAWEQVTLTFTPTVSGIATFHALLLATSTGQTVHVDTFSVTQT